MSTGSAAAVAAGENHPVLMPPSYVNLKSYLSPEYVNCLGKKPNFSESDVEKVSVWDVHASSAVPALFLKTTLFKGVYDTISAREFKTTVLSVTRAISSRFRNFS